MHSVRGLAEKIRKQLKIHPELQETMGASLDRLIKFRGFSETEATKLRLFAGLNVPGFTHLSIVRDEAVYDILDTYELGKRLYLHSGSWVKAWESIRNELTTNDPVYGSATQDTLYRLLLAFEEVQNASIGIRPEQLFFENYARDCDGNLVILT